MMNKTVTICILLLVATCSMAQTLTYTNPLPFKYEAGGKTHRELRDPCIVREGDTYYLVFTVWPFANREEKRLSLPNQGGSPGIKLYSSTDLKDWKFENWLVRSDQLPEDCPYKNRFWAPEIHKIGDRFYLIFTADNWIKKEFNPAGTWGTAGYAFVGVADKITGPYKHITYIEGGACDTSLFEDTNGKTYAVIPAYNVYVQQIDLSRIDQGQVKLFGPRKLVVPCKNDDIGLKAEADYQEGPWMFRRDGRYFLLYAGPYREAKNIPEKRGYWAGIAYADNVMGPWKKDPRGQIFHGGHMAVFDGPDGRFWFSYRWEKDNRHRGLLCLDPITIDGKGRIQCEPSDFLIEVPIAKTRENHFNVKDYGAKADGLTDDSPAFSKTITEAIKSGRPSRVYIPAGQYSLQSAMGRGMITISRASNLTLEGEEETLLISSEPTRHMIHITDASNITVRRLSLDRNPLVFTQGMIHSVDTVAKTVEVTIDKGYDEPDAKYIAPLKSFLVFTDPKADTWDHSRWWPTVTVRERIAPMNWRFVLNIEPLSSYIGKRFLLWDNVYKGWGVVADKSADCLIEDIDYYGGGADAGFGMWRCTGTITCRRFKIGIPPGSDRLIAAAGGSQEFQNRGTLIMEGCDFSRIDDDGVNMGTTYAKILKQIDSRTITVEDKGIPFKVGDTIALWDWFLKKERCQASLVAFIPEDRRSVRLTLDTDVQVLHPAGSPELPKRSEYTGGGRFEEFDGIDRIADFQASGKLIVKNCRFQNMRARNILVKCSNAVIENNTFYNTHMTSILAGPEFYWGEAPAIRNLVIRNNRFINIDGSSINLGSHNSDISYDNRNILIEGNTFENYGALGGVGISGRQGTAVLIRNANEVTIRNNTFGAPATTAPPDARPLVIEISKNVTMEGNQGLEN